MMSTEARESPSGGRDSVESLPPHPYPPHFYPAANYQGQQQPPWFPGQLPPRVSGPWPPAPWGYPGGPGPGWSPPGVGGKISPHNSSAAAPSDEYTVDTMRRIYNDDDGRVEIQRVKVQRRQPETSGALFPPGTDSMSVVPVGTFPLNDRRPPPRKNKMKRQMELMQARQGQQGPYPYYPYMPCMPYPYPYPYYYGGCMWPPGMPSPPPPITPWAGSDDSERTTSRQESLPTTIDSQRLESRASGPSRNSHSPMFQRSPSPAATTHSIAPSDSVSVRSYKDEEALNCILRGPTPPPRTKSRTSTERRVRSIMAPSDVSSEASSIATTCTDLVPYQKLPPRRKNRKSKTVSISDRSSSLDQKDTDSLSDRSSVSSEITCDDSSKLNSELSYAFKNFEHSVDVFKSKMSVESTPVNTPPRSRSPSPIIMHSNSIATNDSIRIPPSEDTTTGEETDTYIEKTDKVDDQPSTTSFSSLPLLETAPLESLSCSTSTKVEVSSSQEIPVVCDSKPEESPHRLPATDVETNANASKSTSDAIPTTITITDPATKADDSQQPSVSVSVQDNSTPAVVADSIAVSSTQDAPEITTGVSSEPVTDHKSQAVTMTNDSYDKDFKPPAGKLEVSEMELEASSGRDSRLSSSTFFSIRPSDDPLHNDTDSTDILLPTTDATTADEGGEGTDWTASSPVVEDTESYQWVLQQPGEIPDLACSTADREDERRNAWRAEVSLWRARLVVSLCRGRGLDRQDWATFHLLVHHPLTLDLKLSMLHAPRLCVTNSTIGAALVRVALIHLAQYGETLLQPEAGRQLGWRSIKVDPNQSWSPVKGAVEILKALGYQEREDGVLRYPRRSGTEVSVLARLTLDMLVLAEELRLYLTGTHQYPTNISDLFFPTGASTPAPSDGPQILQDLPRPPSSTGSYSFLSAQSNTSLNYRADSRASTVTDEETETLQVSVKQVKSNSKKVKQPSSSEEEVTLIEDLASKGTATQDVRTSDHELKLKVEDKAKPPNSGISSTNQDLQTLGLKTPFTEPSLLQQSTTSLDMSSLPDLQSIRSSTVSLLSPPLRETDLNGSITPLSTPVPETEETKDNPEEHIYEEIDVIRQQVQALRASSVPVDIQPPPLPPKKKVSSGGEDDSGLSLTYPHMEWTSASMPGSLPGSLRGGSTGARRKKRRAPMPPDFMPRDWKPYENKPQEADTDRSGNKTKADVRRRLNPFYEDIDSVKDQVKELNKAYESRRKRKSVRSEKDANPFDTDDYVASGFVGKNPFYEDIEEDEDIDRYKNVSRSSASSPRAGGSNVCAMGSLSELQDDSMAIKAKRRAPRPPSTPDPSNRATPQPRRDPSSPPPPKHPPNVPPPNPPSSPQPPKSPSSPQPPKSPSSPPPPPPKSPSSPQPPKSPSSPLLKPPSTTPPPRPPAPQQQKSKDVCKESTSRKENTDHVDECSTTDPIASSKISVLEVSDNKAQQQTTDTGKGNKKDQTSDGINKSVDDKTSARNVVSKAIVASQQRSQVQHPTIPPPPPPPKLDDDEEAHPSIPASASQDKTPSLLEDIPYMDANEIKTEKAKLAQSETPQSPQYEIPELPGKDGIPPAPLLSPTIMRQTAMLLSGHRSVPFIDESDLPPEGPPPPPPSSPPDSPSETPKASPPETPHTSPPETPHVSPPETPHVSSPETPCGSCPSSPITIQQDTHAPSTGSIIKNDNGDISSVIPQTGKSNEEEIASKTEDNQMTASAAEEESSSQTKSPSLPATETLSSSLTKEETSEDSEIMNEPPPLPPKTVISQKNSNGAHLTPSSPSDTYANQSIQSSISEERYEIPDTPKPPGETLEEEVAVKLEAIKEDVKIEHSTPHEPPTEEEEEAAEERYEIPEVVKETALSIGPEGMPVRVGGPAQVNRMDLESVFGPPKPPRRRRNNSLPPPRPPKSMILEGSAIPKLPPKSATTVRPASASTTSSFVTASAGSPSLSGTPTSLQGTPKPTHKKRRSDKTRRSWPLLFCDCMYVK